MGNEAITLRYIEVTARDLPLACPGPDMSLWNSHPKVYLAIEGGEARCPYCGTLYRFKGELPKGHH